MEESTKNVFYSIFYFSYSLIKSKPKGKLFLLLQNKTYLSYFGRVIASASHNTTEQQKPKSTDQCEISSSMIDYKKKF